MSRTPAGPTGPPPVLDEHSASVVSEWLAPEAQALDELVAAGVIVEEAMCAS